MEAGNSEVQDQFRLYSKCVAGLEEWHPVSNQNIDKNEKKKKKEKQWVWQSVSADKGYCHRASNLSLICGTHTVDGENWLPKLVLWHLHYDMCLCAAHTPHSNTAPHRPHPHTQNTHTHTHIILCKWTFGTLLLKLRQMFSVILFYNIFLCAYHRHFLCSHSSGGERPVLYVIDLSLEYSCGKIQNTLHPGFLRLL